MAWHQQVTYLILAAAVLLWAPVIPGSERQATNDSHKAVVTWSADLKALHENSSSQAPSMGKATFLFDFDHQMVTISVDTQNIHDVERIELRVARASSDFSGPSAFTLYDSKDAKFSPTFTKIIKNPSFAELSKIVLNGRGVIVITSKTHPEGEAEGYIRMHKSYL
jgi:CHRD domain